MRQRADVQPRKLSLIRPSSGYYGYNTKRTDSDTDLGRFSSNNVRFGYGFCQEFGNKLFHSLFFYRASHPAVRRVV